MSCGVGRRRGLDLVLLWYRPEAVALIRPLAWGLPYAVAAVALKSKTNKQNQILYDKYIYFIVLCTKYSWNILMGVLSVNCFPWEVLLLKLGFEG